MNASNNYKDAAQQNFTEFKETFFIYHYIYRLRKISTAYLQDQTYITLQEADRIIV